MSSWICYSDGQWLRQELDLMEKLRPLFEYGLTQHPSLHVPLISRGDPCTSDL